MAFEKVDDFAKSDWWDGSNSQEREAVNSALLRLSRSKRAMSNLLSIVKDGFKEDA